MIFRLQDKKKLLTTKLEKFLAKRVLIISVILAILILVLFRHHVVMLAGLAVGAVFGLLRLNSYVTTFSKIFSKGNEANSAGRITARFIISSVLTILLLAASAKYELYFFFGVLSGIFSVPLVIIINGITEALGITNNNFE